LKLLTDGSNTKTAATASIVGKLVANNAIMKSHQKEKMVQEIMLHKELRHKNVVQFIDNFRTSEFVVIIMELCPNHSLKVLGVKNQMNFIFRKFMVE